MSAGLVVGLVLLGLRLASSAPPGGQWLRLGVAPLLSGTQLVFLSIVGEYLARSYDEVHNRALYSVRELVGFDEES